MHTLFDAPATEISVQSISALMFVLTFFFYYSLESSLFLDTCSSRSNRFGVYVYLYLDNDLNNNVLFVSAQLHPDVVTDHRKQWYFDKKKYLKRSHCTPAVRKVYHISKQMMITIDLCLVQQLCGYPFESSYLSIPFFFSRIFTSSLPY